MTKEELLYLTNAGFITDVSFFNACLEHPEMMENINITDYINQTANPINLDICMKGVEPEVEPEVESVEESQLVVEEKPIAKPSKKQKV